MIDKDTIDEIFQTARVEEVIGEFVNLKKSGSSFKGLSPFSSEKTPSFMVSPAKGIWKDFSSGKGGNVVGFLMELEGFSYPEALRWLAAKYGIEIEEEERTPEQQQEINEKESLYLVNNFALEYFEDHLHNSNEGKAIGLSYFKERGFTPETIEKFRLGYSPDSWDAFSKAATDKGYQKSYLLQAGLLKERDDKLFDFFRSRIIFPIRNLSGRAIAFGARTLLKDKKVPKYLNSPETPVYNKSQVLYGIYESKKSIINKDMCFLVEGYTDVISMHQAGVENVVASSGTALTQGQIRLVRRYTNNITILYDGDAAGIRASFRGIDLILEEGLNVKVILFPDGEDPDSFAQSHSAEELEEFLTKEAKDFIVFKADILMKDAKNDPVKRAGLVKEMVNSIALIPDLITRSVYIQECSSLMGIDEQTLISAMNKVRRTNLEQKQRDAQRRGGTSTGTISAPTIPTPAPVADAPPGFDMPPPELEAAFYEQEMGIEPQPQESKVMTQLNQKLDFQEADLARILVSYGDRLIELELTHMQDDGPDEIEHVKIPVGHFVALELMADHLHFINPLYQKVFDVFRNNLEAPEDAVPGFSFFVQQHDQELATLATDLGSSKYELSSGWQKSHFIFTATEEMRLRDATFSSIYSFKLAKVEHMIGQLQEQLKTVADEEELVALMTEQKKLMSAKSLLSEQLGRTIIN